MQMNKAQKDLALNLNFYLREQGVPDYVTSQEAAALCIQQGVAEPKYSKYKNNNPYRRLDVAMYIAKSGGEI
jgi:hypothetical protein